MVPLQGPEAEEALHRRDAEYAESFKDGGREIGDGGWKKCLTTEPQRAQRFSKVGDGRRGREMEKQGSPKVLWESPKMPCHGRSQRTSPKVNLRAERTKPMG
jgi:hypothetical protein